MLSGAPVYCPSVLPAPIGYRAQPYRTCRNAVLQSIMSSAARASCLSRGPQVRVRATGKRRCCCKAEVRLLSLEKPRAHKSMCRRSTIPHSTTSSFLQATARDDVVKARAEVTRRIKQLGQQGKPKQAISELTQLAKMGIQPDTQAATALVSACTTNRNMVMALNVFEELFGTFTLFEFCEKLSPLFCCQLHQLSPCDP